MGALRRNLSAIDADSFTAVLQSRGPASEAQLLASPAFRTMRSLTEQAPSGALADALAGWSSGNPRWLSSSWRLLDRLRQQADETSPSTFAATFRVAAERVSAVADDASLALSPRDRASLYAFFADLVGAGLPDSLVSPTLCEQALTLYDKALDLFPALSAEAWYHSGYTELMLLKQQHPRASLQGVQARLWGALERNATFEASLSALQALGLELPRGSAVRKAGKKRPRQSGKPNNGKAASP